MRASEAAKSFIRVSRRVSRRPRRAAPCPPGPHATIMRPGAAPPASVTSKASSPAKTRAGSQCQVAVPSATSPPRRAQHDLAAAVPGAAGRGDDAHAAVGRALDRRARPARRERRRRATRRMRRGRAPRATSATPSSLVFIDLIPPRAARSTSDSTCTLPGSPAAFSADRLDGDAVRSRPARRATRTSSSNGTARRFTWTRPLAERRDAGVGVAEAGRLHRVLDRALRGRRRARARRGAEALDLGRLARDVAAPAPGAVGSAAVEPRAIVLHRHPHVGPERRDHERARAEPVDEALPRVSRARHHSRARSIIDATPGRPGPSRPGRRAPVAMRSTRTRRPGTRSRLASSFARARRAPTGRSSSISPRS